MEGTSDKRSPEPYTNFVVVVNDIPSPLQDRDNPCFKSILSEGDKSSLAFAFFIAKLNKSKNLQDTVIVFDDPVSSMDNHRRVKTVEIMRDISLQSQQCIILSHNFDFLCMVHDAFPETRSFCIKSDEATGSKINVFNIDDERRDKQHKRIDRLELYCKEDKGGSPEDIQSEIRRCLETLIRFKYFKRLGKETTLGKMLDALKSQNVLSPEIMQACRDLNRISSEAHHGEYKIQPLQSLTREEVIADIKQLFEILEKI